MIIWGSPGKNILTSADGTFHNINKEFSSYFCSLSDLDEIHE